MVRTVENSQVLAPVLLVLQTTWLKITGRKEVCREIVIDKLKPFRQTPDNIRKWQMEADEVLEEDLDEEAVEPYMDPEDSQARVDYIQCVDIVPCFGGAEEVTILEEKDNNWGGRLPTQTQGCMDPP